MTDIELIKLLNKSDKASFEALYDKYVGMVYNFINSVLRNDEIAQDLTQWCFMKLWECRQSISPDKNLPAWLYVTARNAAYKETRRQLTVARYLDRISLEDVDVTSEKVSDADVEIVKKEVLKVINELPHARRRIFIMRTFEHKSVAQIAQELGISPKTVETQIYRAKSSVRKGVSELLFVAFILVSGL